MGRWRAALSGRTRVVGSNFLTRAPPLLLGLHSGAAGSGGADRGVVPPCNISLPLYWRGMDGE